jgi:hypothetical protein
VRELVAHTVDLDSVGASGRRRAPRPSERIILTMKPLALTLVLAFALVLVSSASRIRNKD